MQNEEKLPQKPDDVGIVENAHNVSHADVVTNAVQTDVARTVSHAENVGHVEIHGEPIRSDRTRKLAYIREIARSFLTFFSLIVMVVVIIDKNINENKLQHQLKVFQTEREASDNLTAKKLECTRRFTDAISVETEKQLILIGEFLVVIIQIPAGPERMAAVKAKSDELDRTNIAARAAMAAMIEYNKQGNPLPCPIGPTPIPPVPEPPDAGLPITSTTTSVTPTT